MAPKRSAPMPAPPAASSEETTSGSGSDESEEEEMAQSPPPAAPKAPPPQKGQESETDDEEEDDDEEEEEEVEKANHATPPAVPKNPPPPPPTREESESEEEEEETDDEAPQPKPAPKQEAERKVLKLPSSSEDKKPGAAPFHRSWSLDDEARILEAMAAHRREHGTLPQPDALVAALAGRLDHSGYSRAELQTKLKNMKRRYTVAAKKSELPSKDQDRRLFDLSRDVWGDKVANGAAPREYGEMCELYPHLAEEVKALEAKHPGLFKREFAMIHDDKARALDVKIKKQRLAQMRLEMRRHDLIKEVTKELMQLAD